MKVILVVLVCVVAADAQVFDALKVMVENAWDSFKEFIKRPPRSHMKRVNVKTEETYKPVGFILRLKTTPTAADITTQITTAQNTMPPDIMYYFQRPIHKPVLLPLIPAPKWRPLDGYSWYDYQDSEGFAFHKHQSQGSRKGRFWDNGDETTSALSDEPAEDIGVMMFV